MVPQERYLLPKMHSPLALYSSRVGLPSSRELYRGRNWSQSKTFLQCHNTPLSTHPIPHEILHDTRALLWTNKSRRRIRIIPCRRMTFRGKYIRQLPCSHDCSFLVVGAFQDGATELREEMERGIRLLLSRALDSASTRYCRINYYLSLFFMGRALATRTVSLYL